MSADWVRVRELFERVVELEPTARRQVLDRECDDALRTEVERLLAGDAVTGTPIERELPSGLLGHDRDPSIVGGEIGGYEIRGLLGSGGMSTVFEAVQPHPARTVALKTMRFGLTSAAAKRRFEYEAEVLARLQHPAIAQVYEAGTWTEPVSGQELPFFAMELVEGARPLDEFARDLDLRSVLQLFVVVCAGVHYGHQLGFLHRDLKPQNILVDAHGRPKIIDFGIARTTDASERTLLTEAGQVLGTLRYMAPEQLAGDAGAVDLRVDVYALGVVLYELLAGESPFVGSGDTSIHAVAERIRTVEPPAPSTRAAVPRDLDWIVGKSIAKESHERYASVSELAADLQRFLTHEPVTAGPPSTTYRLRKFVRRNKVVVAAVAAVALALIAGIVATTWQMYEAQAARDDATRKATEADEARADAELQAARVQGVNDFYNILLGYANPFERRSRASSADISMREALELAAAKLDAGEIDEIGDEPEIEADVRFTIGHAYRAFGAFDDAKRHLERALELRREAHGPKHVDVAAAIDGLAIVVEHLGDIEQAIAYYNDAIAIYREIEPDGLAITHSLSNLALTLNNSGEFEAAEELLLDVIDRLERLGPERDNFRAISVTTLAVVRGRLGDRAAAMELYRESLALYESSGKGWHPYSANTRVSLASMLMDAGQLDEAESLLLEAVEIYDSQIGPASPDSAGPHSMLTNLYLKAKQLPEAYEHARLASRARVGPAGEPTLGSLGWARTAGIIAMGLGRPEQSERELLEILDVLDNAELGPEGGRSINDRKEQTRQVLSVLVTLYTRWGKPEEKARFEARLAALK